MARLNVVADASLNGRSPGAFPCTIRATANDGRTYISEVLDPPGFSRRGIDPKAVNDIQSVILYLRDRGIGLLITDHNVRETLGVTDRAYIMAEGKIFRAGPPRDLTEDAEVRRLYLGEKFRM